MKKKNTGGGRGCFGRRPTWDRKQRWMRGECEQDPTLNSMPRGLKYSAGDNHDDDLDSVVLVGVVGVSNASSLGRLSLVKSSFDHDLPATWISPQRPWRYHDTVHHRCVNWVGVQTGSRGSGGSHLAFVPDSFPCIRSHGHMIKPGR